jgi:ABC-type hemin transport system ATPase subunit
MLPDGLRRALLLDNGRTIFDGKVDEALSGKTLSELFGYPLETFKRNGRRFVSYG